MKSLHYIGQLLNDESFVFYVAFNDNTKDLYCGYFSQSVKPDPVIAELKPIALAEIKDNGFYLQDHEKAFLNAKQLFLVGGEKALKDTIQGCKYDIKLHGDRCYAYHLSAACVRVLNQSKGK